MPNSVTQSKEYKADFFPLKKGCMSKYNSMIRRGHSPAVFGEAASLEEVMQFECLIESEDLYEKLYVCIRTLDYRMARWLLRYMETQKMTGEDCKPERLRFTYY